MASYEERVYLAQLLREALHAGHLQFVFHGGVVAADGDFLTSGIEDVDLIGDKVRINLTLVEV